MKEIVILICIIFISSTVRANNIIKNSNYKYCNFHNFTYFFLDIYDIYLCVNEKKFFAQEKIYQNNFSIIIQYNMNFSNKELAKSSIEEISRYYDINDSDKTKYYQKLLTIFPNIKKTDIIEARYSNGTTKLYHNQNFTGKIKNNKFSKIFLDIWLHKNNKYQTMIKDLYRNAIN